MRKLNPPTYRVRTVKVFRAVVPLPGHEKEWRIEDERGEYDEWCSPTAYVGGTGNLLTGRMETVQQCVGSRPHAFFRARRVDGDWQFLKFLAHYHKW